MLHKKGKMTTLMMMVLVVLFGTASFSLPTIAQAQPGGMMGYGWGPGGGSTGTGWGCGPAWKGGQGTGWMNGMWGGSYARQTSQFMAQGQIVDIDTQTFTITITLDRGSPNLLNTLGLTPADLPTDVSFQMRSTVKVWGSGWNQGKWGSGSLTLADLKPGDAVNLMGYFDKTSGEPVVSYVNVWLY